MTPVQVNSCHSTAFIRFDKDQAGVNTLPTANDTF